MWTWFRDKWLMTRRAAGYFIVSAVLVLGVTPMFLGRIDTSKMSFLERLPWGILGMVGPIAVFFLWIGMWRYWVRLDDSKPMQKRLWFVILLVGFWWGSCLYCFFVYLPQIFRRVKAEA
jgi:uncharacterized BrkB/YihY/UPF0761 family membrane protein